MSASTNTNLITRTVLSGMLQTCLLAGIPLTVLDYTTLNQRLGINEDAKLASNETPTFGYWCIGDKGHWVVPTSDGEVIIEPAEHTAGDFAPFNMIPFVMREESNDLSVEERKKYGLRKSENRNGINYFSYYAKAIDLTGKKPRMERTTVKDGVATTTEYTPNNSNLYPERKTLTTNEAVTTNSDTLTVSLTTDVLFDDNDVKELNNVSRILYGNEKRAIISEIALVSAFKRVVQAPGPGGGAISITEAICAQVLTFLSTYRQMSFDNRGFVITLEMGANEPMMTSDAVGTSSGRDAVQNARQLFSANIAPRA
ncbi:putative virion structural protein [Serratia phage vB_SmaM_Haymo]|nr:putative virion structural protein [Serratia phage vB_SmaM_Haymo]